MMEINTEISKVFGEEMAKLFASQISEEEMQKAAAEAWEKLRHHEWKYGSRQDSRFDNLIEAHIVRRLMEEVEKKLAEPEPAEEIEKEVISIVAEAKAKAREMIVERLAEGYARAPFINYDLQELSSNISRAVYSALNG